MISTHDLSKVFVNGTVSTPALSGVSLEIPSGQFVAVVGPSGSGKSTLLYQLSLLDEPTGGRIIIDGQETGLMTEVQKTAFRLRSFGFVFQDYALLPELTALENVLLPGIMAGQSWEVAEEQARGMLERIDMLSQIGKLPSQLSGGQQQRVSIARAAARRPAILFADEPTANLDSQHSHEVIDVFLSLNAGGQTIVMVTHEQEFAEKAQRTIELRDGRIARDTGMSG
jgi:putative ABC transport system ATP-binding protein